MALRCLLKRYRLQRGLSQRELAQKAHVRQATISNVETGKKKDVLSGTVLKLARALEVTVEQLLGQDSTLDPYTTPLRAIAVES